VKNLVSVIIPTFNFAHFIEETIDSVLKQTYKTTEIIVVDDGSTDKTQSVLNKYVSLPNFRLITSTNSGACIARNRGVLASRGEYLLFLDADDVIHESMLEKLLTSLQVNDQRTRLAYCAYSLAGETSHRYFNAFEQTESSSLQDWFWDNVGKTPFPPSVTIIHRSLLAEAGMWDTALKSPSEDFDFFRRLAKYTLFKGCNENLVARKKHAESLTRRSPNLYFEDNIRAVRRMFSEDLISVGFAKRQKAWIKIHLNFIKHSIVIRDSKLTLRVVKSFLAYFK
jgi:glycosyltransferase involved in cell wall biosynthesis